MYHGPGEKSWTDAPDPQIQNPTDIIVRMDTTTICGTDLHILKGDVPAVTPGRILGHEGVGIDHRGGQLRDPARGRRQRDHLLHQVVWPLRLLQAGHLAHCLGDEGASGIGWVFGHLIDGTQAEYVRVPYAETSLYKCPTGVTDSRP